MRGPKKFLPGNLTFGVEAGILDGGLRMRWRLMTGSEHYPRSF